MRRASHLRNRQQADLRNTGNHMAASGAAPAVERGMAVAIGAPLRAERSRSHGGTVRGRDETSITWEIGESRSAAPASLPLFLRLRRPDRSPQS